MGPWSEKLRLWRPCFNEGTFKRYFEKLHLTTPLSATLWLTFGKLRLLFIPTSGHTGHIYPHLKTVVTPIVKCLTFNIDFEQQQPQQQQ